MVTEVGRNTASARWHRRCNVARMLTRTTLSFTAPHLRRALVNLVLAWLAFACLHSARRPLPASAPLDAM